MAFWIHGVGASSECAKISTRFEQQLKQAGFALRRARFQPLRKMPGIHGS